MARKVLLVDDDHFFQVSVAEFLSAQGYDVAVASSWVDFTSACYSGTATPQIILFDVDLGSTMSGDKLLAVFRSGRMNLPLAQRAKLVLFSSLPEPELAERAKASGADGYIHKSSFDVRSGTAFLAKLESFLASEKPF